jgi:hypothetical protein
MRTHEKLDLATVRTETLEYIRVTREKAAIHEVVAETLKTFQGKRVSKRMATAISKALGEKYTVRVFPEYGWHALTVWGDGKLDYSDRYSVTLAYESDPGPAGDKTFDFDYWVKKHANGYGGSKLTQWANDAENALRTAEVRVAAYNAAVETVDKAYAALAGLIK